MSNFGVIGTIPTPESEGGFILAGCELRKGEDGSLTALAAHITQAGEIAWLIRERLEHEQSKNYDYSFAMRIDPKGKILWNDRKKQDDYAYLHDGIDRAFALIEYAVDDSRMRAWVPEKITRKEDMGHGSVSMQIPCVWRKSKIERPHLSHLRRCAVYTLSEVRPGNIHTRKLPGLQNIPVYHMPQRRMQTAPAFSQAADYAGTAANP